MGEVPGPSPEEMGIPTPEDSFAARSREAGEKDARIQAARSLEASKNAVKAGEIQEGQNQEKYVELRDQMHDFVNSVDEFTGLFHGTTESEKHREDLEQLQSTRQQLVERSAVTKPSWNECLDLQNRAKEIMNRLSAEEASFIERQRGKAER